MDGLRETREVEEYYASARIGDPTFSNGLRAEDRCVHPFFSPWEDPETDSPWRCTRLKGHAPPHLAEGRDRIFAIAPVIE